MIDAAIAREGLGGLALGTTVSCLFGFGSVFGTGLV
jgi:hypothetical protein